MLVNWGLGWIRTARLSQSVGAHLCCKLFSSTLQVQIRWGLSWTQTA